MYSQVGLRYRWLLDPTPSEEYWYKSAQLDRRPWSVTGPTILLACICAFLGVIGILNGTDPVVPWIFFSITVLLIVTPIVFRWYARRRNTRFMFSGKVFALDYGAIGEGLRTLIFRDAPEFDTSRQLAVIRESSTGEFGIRAALHPLNDFLRSEDNIGLLYALDTRDLESRQEAFARLKDRAGKLLDYMDKFVRKAQAYDRSMQDYARQISELAIFANNNPKEG